MDSRLLFLKARASPASAQIEAGNYKLRHRRFRGLDISIEKPRGSVRRGTGTGGSRWRTKMKNDYGYIRGSHGADKEHVDCYLGPDEEAPYVYVVHQRRAGNWTQFDEDKCMLGFPGLAAAKRAYLAHYDDPRFLGPVSRLPFEDFRRKVLATGEHKPRGANAMIKHLMLFFPRLGS